MHRAGLAPRRSALVSAARGSPLLTAISRLFWHGCGTASPKDQCRPQIAPACLWRC
jgi:hypothetical protein